MLEQELFELQEELKIEMQIVNTPLNPYQEYEGRDDKKNMIDGNILAQDMAARSNVLTPSAITNMPIYDLRNLIMKNSFDFQQLRQGNKEMKEKIRKCAIQVQNIEIIKAKLKQKWDTQLVKQRSLQDLQEMRKRI